MNGRNITDINIGWKFLNRDADGARNIDFDDSALETVSLPHANRILDRHKGEDFETQIESYRFVSWYRYRFSLPESFMQGSRVIIEFEAVATAAEVYINGNLAAEHKGAYTGFSVDTTEYLNTTGDNVIAVRVDSTHRADIPPEGGDVDYCLFGGIVRGVKMIITGGAYIENVFITTPDLEKTNGQSGRVHAEISMVNTNETKKYTVEMNVFGADGKLAAHSAAAQTAGGGAKVTFEQTADSAGAPRLWSPDTPYLYTVNIRVMSGDECVDEYTDKIGFRWFRFKDGQNGDGGLYINGKKTVIVGVNRHEQWAWLGRAANNRHQRKDAELIKQTGFNAVRCSHYPQSPAFLRRCDEIGLIVFEEAPGWQHIGDERWQAVYMENLREMITRDRNHPSVISWGVRVNESADNDEFYTKTNEIAHSLDMTRPTHGTRRAEEYADSHILEDIYTAHYVHPEKPRFVPFVITEHSNDWYDGHGFPWASDRDMLTFTRSFADEVNYYFGNDLCAGGFAWSMFDYNNEANYTKTGHVFYSGVYDIFRTEKMPAYFYKSQKNPKDGAMVYIANYWTEDSPHNVTIFSNCDEIELFLNGVSQGRKSPSILKNLPHPLCEFEPAYAPGELRAVGYINGVAAAEYTVKTPLKAVRVILRPDDETIAADGADFTRVTITAVDENGTVVPYADNIITISCEGARFIGENPITLEGGRSAFYVQSLCGKTGAVKCAASAAGLETGECTIVTA